MTKPITHSNSSTNQIVLSFPFNNTRYDASRTPLASTMHLWCCLFIVVVALVFGEHISRVEIHVSSENKHRLPVQRECRWSHNSGITRREEGCLTVAGRPVQNFHDIWLCMVEANCDVSGAPHHVTSALIRPTTVRPNWQTFLTHTCSTYQHVTTPDPPFKQH